MDYEVLRLETVDLLNNIKTNAEDLRQYFNQKDVFEEKLQHLYVMFSKAEHNIINLGTLKGVDVKCQ